MKEVIAAIEALATDAAHDREVIALLVATLIGLIGYFRIRDGFFAANFHHAVRAWDSAKSERAKIVANALRQALEGETG